MYNINAKSEQIRIKFCTLDPNWIREVTTKFSLKILFLAELLIFKYL